ncbi:MAG: hypothetical protein F4X20_04265 [Dehalococcoidia bacterium]|nr:hypothetical protein [Dehalococcoidia bacterium]
MSQERIRDAMQNADRQYRYYLAIADRLDRLHIRFSAVAILASIVAATLLFTSWDELLARYASAVLFLIVSGATVIPIVNDYSRKAQLARSASEQLSEVVAELVTLWHSAERGQNVDPKTIEHWEKRTETITRVPIPTDYSLNERVGEESWKIINDYYPSSQRESEADPNSASA